MDAQHLPASRHPGRHAQRGATALEFALVFPALFLLFYATLGYGLIFTARMSLQHAAEEGARSALSHRVGAPGQVDATPLSLRRAAAEAAAAERLGWLQRWTTPTVEARICSEASDCSVETTTCGHTLATACRMQVTVTYPYASHPMIPRVAGFGPLWPDELRGQASVLLDGRLLR